MVYLFVVQFYAMLCVTSRQHTPIHASSESVRLLTLPTIRVYSIYGYGSVTFTVLYEEKSKSKAVKNG